MRLLVVSQYFWPENFRVNDLVLELANRGHQITVLTGIPNYPNGRVYESYQIDPESFNTFSGVEVLRVPMMPRGVGGLSLIINYLSFTISASIFGLWKLRGRSFDAVFVNQLSPVFIGLPGVLIAKVKKIPMAMWVLDLWPDTLHAIGVVTSPRVLEWIGRLVSFIYNRCDLIFAQSKSFIPEIRKLATSTHAIEYLPSWAEEIFKTASITLAVEIPNQDGKFDVMFAGNIGEAQDFPCILAAAEKLKKYTNIRWLIIGDGRMRPWLEQEIYRRGLSQNVQWLGRFPVERMPSFYQGAHALLVTLQNKPIFGMTIPGKLQSYLAAGKPVVAALNGEGAALIKAAEAGYVSAAGDSEGLASAVLSLSQLSDSERHIMGQNGRSVCKDEFDRNIVIGRLESYLTELSDAK